jgi:hypothetical protein
MSDGLDGFDHERLNRLLEASPDWEHGAVEVESTTRVGVQYGLSGRISRVVGRTADGRTLSVVVKEESAEAVERELLFHRENGAALRGVVPRCFGGGDGVLLLEDVSPADQGDVLRGCSDERAEAVVRALARVHGASWRAREDAFPGGLPRWPARPMEQDRWADRLARAADRFPQHLTPPLVATFRDLTETVAADLEQLWAGPASWLHVDAHLDNVLWRPDGTAVLLDWCNAAIGPPAVDLVRCLTEGIDAGPRPERGAALASAYKDELESTGIAGVGDIDLPVATLVQSAVEWAGRPEECEPRGRTAALRENLLRSSCAWVTVTPRR